jgi:hypothetical protein
MSTAATLLQATPATSMAQEHSLSPAKPSPRRALQTLSPNPKRTPRGGLSGVEFASTAKPTTKPTTIPLKGLAPPTKTAALSMKESCGSLSVNDSRKRSFDDANVEERDCSPRRSPKAARMSKETKPDSRLGNPNIPPVCQILPTRVFLIADTSQSITIFALPKEPQSPTTEKSTESPQLPLDLGSKKVEGSFSSLIDYDPQNTSDVLSAVSSTESGCQEVVKTVTTRAGSVHLAFLTTSQRAEILRLRLRMAMFRINTDQIKVPFSQLRLPSAFLEKSHPPASHNTLIGPASPISPPLSDAGSATDEDEILPAEPEALPISVKMHSSARSLKLLPAPRLQPTEYSSRKIAAPLVTSSPPELPSPEKAVVTPVRTEMRRSVATFAPSPDKVRLGGEDLTSSVVKRDAASGLLGLKRGL